MRISRPLVALAATALVAGLATSPAHAASPYDGTPAKLGATWLAGELEGGLVHNDEFAFDDIGLSIDFALGLDGARRKPRAVQAIASAVAPRVTEYTSFETSVFAGQVAKAAVLAITAGRDPRSFGGQDLIAQLEGRVSSTAPIAGRIEDNSSFGDLANVVGQVHAVHALTSTHSAKAKPALAFLLAQQCSKGFFRETFSSDKARTDQSCQGAPLAERAPSTDTTALAVLALLDVKGAAARRAVDNGVDWLVGHHRANGSFSTNGKSSSPANANSTGLAGWALGEAGATRLASRAATWLRSLQVPSPNPCSLSLARQTGAIAYDLTAYRKGQRKGITTGKADQWRRASSQAVAALRWSPRAVGRFTASAPAAVAAGSTLRISLTGVAPGARVCVKDGGSTYEVLPGRKATTHVDLSVDDAGSHTFKVFVGSVRRDVTVRVTG